MKILTSLFTFTLLLTSYSATAADRFISDKLFVYFHSGPSAQYRIIGSVNAGTKVQVKQYDTNTGFAQIEDERGRVGWVETKYVSEQEPALKQLPKVIAELEETQATLANIEQSNNQVLIGKDQALSEQNDTITALMTEKQALTDEIIQLKADNAQLQTQLDNQSEDVQMRWLSYGGAVLGAGIFIGFIIPFLPRRKRKDPNWV